MNIITTITASTLIGVTAFTPLSAAANPTGTPTVLAQSGTVGTDCVAEASAFTEVADLASLYREDAEVFASAIEELRDQLLDCLATFDDSEGRSMYPASNDRLKLI